MSQEEDDAENALVAELRALAGSPQGDRFVISRRGHAITVTHNSGSSSNVRLRASYDAAAHRRAARVAPGADGGSYRSPPALGETLVAPRPLAIVLRNEAPAGARNGHQTGDPRFDTSVVIDTATTHAGALSAVLGQEVRAGVLALFDLGFLKVTIDDPCVVDGSDVVEAYLWTFASSSPPKERASRCLDAFATILDHLPRIESSGDGPQDPKAPRWVSALGWLGLVGLLGMWPVGALVSTETRCADAGCPGQALSLVAAVVLGLVASFIAAAALRTRLSTPRAGAFGRMFLVRVRVFAGTASLVFFLAMLAMLITQRR